MLWLDIIDIIYLLVGVLLGYILSILIHRDLWTDECESCEYREFIEGWLNDESESCEYWEFIEGWLNDESESCEYREFIEGWLNDERE